MSSSNCPYFYSHLRVRGHVRYSDRPDRLSARGGHPLRPRHDLRLHHHRPAGQGRRPQVHPVQPGALRLMQLRLAGGKCARGLVHFYRVAPLLPERNMLTSNSKFHWWPGSDDRHIFKFVFNICLSQSRWATLQSDKGHRKVSCLES